MKSDPTKWSLPEARRRLVEEMQRVFFGRFENLRIEQGDPVFDPALKTIIEYKFPSETSPRIETKRDDFALKAHVVELFRHFDHIGDGVIDVLEIKHGLPFMMRLTGAA